MTEAKKDDNSVVDSGDLGTGGKPAAQTVELDIGGTKFAVPPAVAAALSDAKAAAEAAGSKAGEIEARMKAELEALAAKLPKEQPKSGGDPNDDLETSLFTNPKEAIERIIATAVQQATNSIRGETAITNAQNAFWTNFYEAHPELKGDDLVVKAVMNRDFAELKPLKVADAIKKLGEATQKYLLERGVTRKPAKKGGEIEGGNEPGRRKSDTDENSTRADVPSLTDVLKQRRQDRKAAETGKKAA